MTRFTVLLCIALVFVSGTALAGPLASTCNVGPRPAASLLLPYFEVDLADREGITTLLSIGNSSDLPQLARAVLWTDWAIPVTSFDLLLPAQESVSVNLRDVLTGVGPPVTGAGSERPPGCSDPLTQPVVDVDALARQLTGLESPAGSGQCWSSERGQDGEVAVGFMTIDVISKCAAEPRYPTDAGYFADDDSGVASLDNVLYGDFFLVDSQQQSAQGASLVHLPADPEIVTFGRALSFYSFIDGNSRTDRRRPLGSRYLTRFFNGGAFSGGTELLLWATPFSRPVPVTCGTYSPPRGGGGALSVSWRYGVKDENGNGPDFGPTIESPAYASREALESFIIGTTPAGLLNWWSIIRCSICSPPFGGNPGVVIPLHSAEGRFSVGLEAIALDDPCEPQPWWTEPSETGKK